MKVWKLPAGSPTSKGKALVNLLPLDEGETIADIMALPLMKKAGRFECHVRHQFRQCAPQ